MTPEEKAALAKNGSHVEQISTYVSSDISLTKGLICYSKAEVNNHYQRHRSWYQEQARDSVFISQETKENRAFKQNAAKMGIQFVEGKAPADSDLPLAWEVEKYETSRELDVIVVTLKQPKPDGYSYRRVTVTLAEFYQGYTTESVQEQLNRILESTKSVWAAKKKQMKAESTLKTASKIKDDTSDPISKASNVIAEAKQLSPREMAEAMQNVAFKERYMAATKLLADIKAFK